MKKSIYIFYFLLITNEYAHTQQRLWMSPASVRAGFWDMFTPTAKRDTLLIQIDEFGKHVNAFSGNRLDTNVIDNSIKKLFEFVLHPQQQILLEPPDGYVYHGVQLETYATGPDPIAGYLGALNDSTIQPAVHGFFFGIPSTRGPDKALLGLKNFFRGADSIGFTPEVSLFLISDIATDSIIAHSTQYDWIIDSIISISKNYGKSMFLRIGGEFNGQVPTWNGGGYHPNDYVTMFQKIVDKYKAKGLRDSIATIWCYEPDAANDFDSVNTKGALWYPGDDYVDWFGLDVFDADHFDQSLPDYYRGSITKKGKSERFLSMARTKSKPVYMSETSAKGINISADQTDGMNDWNNWFAKFWAFIGAHKEIKGFSYIDANWPTGAYPNWGDARIENSTYITSKYKAEMKNPKYIHLKTIRSTPFIDTIPLTELGLGVWKNNTGGLYANGKNTRPFIHDSAGIAIAKSIVPLDTFGIQDNINGKIVLLSIGMSNATQEYSVFKTLADTFSLKNPKVIVVDGAQSGQTASIIKDPAANFWKVVNQRLTQVNVNPLQVQTVWLKEANANPTDAFPKHAEDLKSDLKEIIRVLKIKYPNLKLAYFSSRIYAGYANTTLNPEPYAYESGFSVKWLIDEQIKGDTALRYNGNRINAPWLSWGPYLWAKGNTARQDGLVWLTSDLGSDGTHPSNSGRLKVANMLLNFFSTDSSSIPWFLKKISTASNNLNSMNGNIDLHQNIPNPFGNETTFKWESRIEGKTSLTIYDIYGHEIYQLVNEFQGPGEHEFHFTNTSLPSGIYYYKIQIAHFADIGKMVKLK